MCCDVRRNTDAIPVSNPCNGYYIYGSIMVQKVDRKFKASKLLYTKTILNLKGLVIYIICNITGGTLCYVLNLKGAGGFPEPKETPSLRPCSL